MNKTFPCKLGETRANKGASLRCSVPDKKMTVKEAKSLVESRCRIKIQQHNDHPLWDEGDEVVLDATANINSISMDKDGYSFTLSLDRSEVNANELWDYAGEMASIHIEKLGAAGEKANAGKIGPEGQQDDADTEAA